MLIEYSILEQLRIFLFQANRIDRQECLRVSFSLINTYELIPRSQISR